MQSIVTAFWNRWERVQAAACVIQRAFKGKRMRSKFFILFSNMSEAARVIQRCARRMLFIKLLRKSRKFRNSMGGREDPNTVGPGTSYSPRHPTHSETSFHELNDIL